MTTRLNHFETTPALTKALMDASMAAYKTSIDPLIKSLIDIRASQLNGCAFCLDMHIKQAKIKGERELRIYHVAIWRESPLFNAKEKAALALTEALTKLPDTGVSDELYTATKEHFTDVEMSELTYSIGLINFWNRMQILALMQPGSQDAAFGLTKAGLN
ncbi:carboxymuconolactone decarboxylase family protein [Rheinheimera sp. YQF-2]|uniref:Carboxymuconolactone decarboxylase family protein n=1 Tax=Rheinheimera lutimaris TaxID=2740584 RepID=A0A7Y5EGH7_9GAMM|nr:carboxymuconolactone decarboxylase family protein [Rheinheimera lutimaris]NRQ41369.1 carboxymuconolactone decarboxylase family protein [Rheinheimera lutimaris]